MTRIWNKAWKILNAFLVLRLAHNRCSENGSDGDDGDDDKGNADNCSDSGDDLLGNEEKQEGMRSNIAYSKQGGSYSVSRGIKWHEINQDTLDTGTIQRLEFRRKPTEGDHLIAGVQMVSS